MPNVARVGVDLVGGTGVITGPGVPTVVVNDLPISVVGDRVAPHGEPPHTTPTIILGSPNVFAEDRQISVQNISVADCAHPVTTGSADVFAN